VAEHRPNRALTAVLATFFAAMAALALAFWLSALAISGGIAGAIGLWGSGFVAVFGALHIPAAITGILLWHWRRHAMPPLRRAALEAATLYFVAAVALSIFFNYLAMSVLDGMSGGQG